MVGCGGGSEVVVAGAVATMVVVAAASAAVIAMFEAEGRERSVVERRALIWMT